jgi:hypothetical protein
MIGGKHFPRTKLCRTLEVRKDQCGLLNYHLLISSLGDGERFDIQRISCSSLALLGEANTSIISGLF